MERRLGIAGIVLLLNFVPFGIARLIGETMSVIEVIVNGLTIPISLTVVFMAKDPVAVLIRALGIGIVLIVLGLGLREGGKKLVEVGERMNADAEARDYRGPVGGK